jgi:Flp pilus assembly pilin Flp
MGMKNIALLNQFLKDESGQTTTEYILILAVIVTIFMQFRKRLLAIVNKLFGALDTAAQDATNFNEGAN